MNSVNLIGRLTKEPEVKYTEKQMAIGRFTLAVNRNIKREGEAQADFINILAFGKYAENIERYLHKGSKVSISGRLQSGSYKNKDGFMVYTTEVVLETIEFLEKKDKIESQDKEVEDTHLPY